MDVELARYNMIEQQIRPWEVLDPQVLDLLRTTRREDFVPPVHRGLAFVDMQLPLKPGEAALQRGQVMLEPRVEARMLQELQVAKHEKVLEIGTGSGFMAALLGQQSQRVLTLEIDEELAQTARENLQRAGVLNVDVQVADGASIDLSAQAPFDVIVLSGSVAAVPDHIVAWLAPGGRFMGIVGEVPMMRATLVQGAGSGYVTTQPWDTVAPRLLGFPEPPRFSF